MNLRDLESMSYMDLNIDIDNSRWYKRNHKIKRLTIAREKD